MPALKTKPTTKHDVALAEVERKAKRETILAYGAVTTIVILAAAIPVLAMQGLVEPLAGRKTSVNVDVVVSITVAISLMVNGFQFVKGRSQSNELKRLRSRLAELEADR